MQEIEKLDEIGKFMSGGLEKYMAFTVNHASAYEMCDPMRTPLHTPKT